MPRAEAVDTYRALAEANPAFLSDLAGALNDLGIMYRNLGRDAEIDETWKRTLAGFVSEDREELLEWRR